MATFTVAVTGASGFVGRYLVRELISRGHSVRGLVRSREQARGVLPSDRRVTLVEGDIGEHDRVDQLLQGANACINLLGILRESRGPGERPQTFQRIHVDATRLLVSKCTEYGVKRYVQMSALGASDVGVSEYQHTKFEAEMIVRLSDLDWTIFRPSLIHGREGEFIQLAKQWAGGQTQPYFFMPYFTRGIEDFRVPLGPVKAVDPSVAPVAVQDVVRAFASCLDNTKTFGEVYNLAGSETLTWPAMLRFIREHVHGAHAEQPVFGIPDHVGVHMANVAKAIGLGDLCPFDAGMARMGGQDSTATLDKAREDLGWDPQPFRASFERYAASV
jgi:NADH dehydrogenase